MKRIRGNPDKANPSKTAWAIVGVLVGIGIGAKIGVVYMLNKIRKNKNVRRR
jgi:hypothetical protein